MAARYFSKKIVEWYAVHGRPLPWRNTTDPYRIWLSEVILQQTRVAQGLPYYQRFLETFPRITDLAHAPEQKVLRLWQGLGYYTRARNLHKCARTIVADHGGQFPSTSQDLQKLPGIGSYTAAAIASIAFGEKTAVVDGNVFRVLSRVFGIETPINTPAGQREFAELANELIPDRQPDLYNQAVMEFGALQCTPVNPFCEECPLRRQCMAHRHDLATILPVKLAAKKPRKRYFYYLVVQRDGALLMRRRDGKDIWHGLYDFALIESAEDIPAPRLIADRRHRSWFANARDVQVAGHYKHVLSHQEIFCTFILIAAEPAFTPPEAGLAFYSKRQVARLPKPALITRFLGEQFGD